MTKARLPEFYGYYAVDREATTALKDNGGDFSPRVEFIAFDKTVTLGLSIGLYRIPIKPPPKQGADASFSRDGWLKASEDFRRAAEAALVGLPPDAVNIELLRKPVEGKPEMLRLIPAQELEPGLYQLANASRFWVLRDSYAKGPSLRTFRSVKSKSL